jgi:hypothetical protein
MCSDLFSGHLLFPVGNLGVYVLETSSIWKAHMDAAEKSRRTPMTRCDEVRPRVQRTSQSKAGPNSIGALLLGLSILGLPVTLIVVRWMGSVGRVCALIGYGILLTRACFMIRSGAPLRMKPRTARLLYAELVADAIGCGAGLWAWVVWPLRFRFSTRTHATSRRRDPPDASWLGGVAMAAAGPIYVLHTIRLLIYISPVRGLRCPVTVYSSREGIR